MPLWNDPPKPTDIASEVFSSPMRFIGLGKSCGCTPWASPGHGKSWPRERDNKSSEQREIEEKSIPQILFIDELETYDQAIKDRLKSSVGCHIIAGEHWTTDDYSLFEEDSEIKYRYPILVVTGKEPLSRIFAIFGLFKTGAEAKGAGWFKPILPGWSEFYFPPAKRRGTKCFYFWNPVGAVFDYLMPDDYYALINRYDRLAGAKDRIAALLKIEPQLARNPDRDTRIPFQTGVSSQDKNHSNDRNQSQTTTHDQAFPIQGYDK